MESSPFDDAAAGAGRVADPLQEFLRHILDNTGAGGAGLYALYADNPIMFALAAARRPDFPAECLLPVTSTDQILPPDFFLATRWRVMPGDAWGRPCPDWQVTILPIAADPRHPQVLALFHTPAEAARVAGFCDSSADVRQAAELMASLAASRRMPIQQASEALFHTLRKHFFTSLSHHTALNLLVSEYAAAAGLSGIRFFLVKPDRREWKPVFAAWDSPGIMGTDHWHVLFRTMLSGPARLALSEPAADPPAPLGLPVCYLRLDLPPYRCDILLASHNQKDWRPDQFLSLQVHLEQLAAYLEETAPLDSTLQDYTLQKELNQALPHFMGLDDLQLFYRRLPEILRDFLHVESVAVYFREDDSFRLRRFAYAGNAAIQTPPQAVREADPATFLGQCAREGKAILKPQLPDREQRRVQDHREFRSLLYYPLQVGKKLHAVIKAAESRTDRISFAHLHRLSLLEPFLAQAVANNQRHSQLTRRLFYHPDTGLLNRRGFEEAIRQQSATLSAGGRMFSVLMAGLDQADAESSAASSQRSKQHFAELQNYLLKQLPPSAVLAYAGEFTFLALAPGLDLDQSLEVGRKICARTHEFQWQDARRPTFSVGVSSCPINGMSEDELMLCAEQAMTISRYQGGNVASIMGSEIIKKLAVSIFSGFLGRTDFETGPEMVDGVLQRLADGPTGEGRLTTIEMINSLAEAIDAKDSYTRDHTLETSVLSVQLGRRLGLTEEALERLRLAARLHDIGKIGVPERILRKKGKLTAKEMAVIRKHPEIGARILRPIHSLRDIATIIEHHHERWDGTGYPHGLAGEAIPVESRILALIDSFHAMTSHRIYQENRTAGEAMEEIERTAGTQFDPQITALFIEMMQERSGGAEGREVFSVSAVEPAKPYM